MTFRHIILSTVAASGVVLAANIFAPASLSVTTEARADTNISVNFGYGSFYDRLEPYGSWVSYDDDYVFIPRDVDRGWRPYTRGHWSFTKRYGWLWVSNERFGWATYHYGRWGYSRDLGWYWVPGRRWAPAWVAWSRGQNEVAWAPLPPRRGNDIDVNITIGDVPDYYWQAVPTSAFLSINLSDRVIRDRNQVRTIVQQSQPETVRIENNIVINNIIQVNDIEKATNKPVPVLIEKPVTNPDAVGKAEAGNVAIFNPDVQVDKKIKPKKQIKIEQVITARKAQGIQPEDVPSDQPSAAAPVLDKNGKPIAPADQPAAKVEAPAAVKTNPDAPAVIKQDKAGTDTLQPGDLSTPKVDANGKVDGKKSKKTKPAAAEPPAAAAPVVEAPPVNAKKDKAVVAPPVDTTNAPADAPPKKKKKVNGDANTPQDNQPAVQPQQMDQQPGDRKPNKKKKLDAGAIDQQPVDQNATPPGDVQMPPTDGNAIQQPGKKNKKGKVKCDPTVENCY